MRSHLPRIRLVSLLLSGWLVLSMAVPGATRLRSPKDQPGAAPMRPSPTTATASTVPIGPPAPRIFYLVWDAPNWPHEVQYEVWAQWPVFQTNVTFYAAGIYTNRIPNRTNAIIRIWTNLVSKRVTNVTWDFGLPVYWQTTTDTFAPFSPDTNLGGLFRVRDYDTATGLYSPFSPIPTK